MDGNVKNKFETYPAHVKAVMLELRQLIFQTALDLELATVEESLKWGEPTYKVKTGSPIRIDWKEKSPANIYIFFNCQTKLLDTFRELYSDRLVLEGNRAIVLKDLSVQPLDVIKHCIVLALTYKKVKDQPMLGA